jgi:hypothetical protein
MLDEIKEEATEELEGSTEAPQPAPLEEDLLPKPPSKKCPRGIRTFTVARKNDESGVSGIGVVIEGVQYATGQVVLHWLLPPPKGGIAIFESLDDFIKIHITPHPTNKTIITFEDGEQTTYGGNEEREEVVNKPSDSPVQ